jgi:hypothetical protein
MFREYACEVGIACSVEHSRGREIAKKYLCEDAGIYARSIVPEEATKGRIGKNLVMKQSVECL